MEAWQELILQEFIPGLKPITTVRDADGLLLDEAIVLSIARKGFSLLRFDDPVDFRLEYERSFRLARDEGKAVPELVVLIEGNLARLPSDIVSQSRSVEIGLAQIFPKLSYPIVRGVPAVQWDELLTLQEEIVRPLSESDTKQLLLGQLYGVVVDDVRTEADLLRTLLRLHQTKRSLPESIAELFAASVIRVKAFDGWPVSMLAQNPSEFWKFLQERWPVYLDSRYRAIRANTGSDAIADRPLLNVRGPGILPLDQPDIRAYIEDLFRDGVLQPIEMQEASVFETSWTKVGIISNEEHRVITRLERLLDKMSLALNAAQVGHDGWFAVAYERARVLVEWHAASIEARGPLQTRFRDIEQSLDERFSSWLTGHYSSLFSLTSLDAPVTLCHVSRFIAKQLERGNVKRAAVVVVDGLALDQWLILSRACAIHGEVKEGAVFALAPTLTNISRQAIFAGKAPSLFPLTIGGTDSELKHWVAFWSHYELDGTPLYLKSLRETGDLARLEANFKPHSTEVAGLVVDMVDRIMHGMELGLSGMHTQIALWAKGGFFSGLLRWLLDAGFDVFVTADHGNIEAKGRGTLKEGMLSETRGERVRVFNSAIARTAVLARTGDAFDWIPAGLPADYLPLFLKDRTAFVPPGETIVAHGGCTIEELVVPFVWIRKGK